MIITFSQTAAVPSRLQDARSTEPAVRFYTMSANDPAGDTPTTWREMAVARSLDPARVRAENRVQRFLDAALELMGRENVEQLPVIANGRLEGIVTRSLLIRHWRLRRGSTA